MSSQRRAAISPPAHPVDECEGEERVCGVAFGGSEECAGLRGGPGRAAGSLLGGQGGELRDVAVDQFLANGTAERGAEHLADHPQLLYRVTGGASRVEVALHGHDGELVQPLAAQPGAQVELYRRPVLRDRRRAELRSGDLGEPVVQKPGQCRGPGGDHRAGLHPLREIGELAGHLGPGPAVDPLAAAASVRSCHEDGCGVAAVGAFGDRALAVAPAACATVPLPLRPLIRLRFGHAAPAPSRSM